MVQVSMNLVRPVKRPSDHTSGSPIGNGSYHMSESKRGASYAHCDICQTDFSVASGGFNEVKRHVENKKHKTSLLESQVSLH